MESDCLLREIRTKLSSMTDEQKKKVWSILFDGHPETCKAYQDAVTAKGASMLDFLAIRSLSTAVLASAISSMDVLP